MAVSERERERETLHAGVSDYVATGWRRKKENHIRGTELELLFFFFLLQIGISWDTDFSFFYILKVILKNKGASLETN